MSHSMTYKYGGGYRTGPFRKLSREDDLYDDQLFLQSLGEEKIPGYYDDSGTCMDDSWESIVETRNRSTSEQSGFKLLQERDKGIKDLSDKLMKKDHQCHESHDKISLLEKQLLIVRKQLVDSESKIITIKIEDRKKSDKLERDINDLKRKLGEAKIHISGHTNRPNLRCNLNTASEYTRETKNNLVEMKLKMHEYERKIEVLEGSNKKKEVQMSTVRDQYNACLRKQQKMKADFSKSVSSLQRDLALRDDKIKDLADQLKKYKGISSESNIDHFKNTERSSTEIKCKIKLSNQEMINLEQNNEHHKSLTELRSECQDKARMISDLERQLKEALQKLHNKTEELSAKATSHRNEVSNFNTDYTRLETQCKAQQRSISSHERTFLELTEANKSLHKMIEDKEKQFHQQMEQHQEALKQMQERENRIDMQKKEILRLKNELHRSKNAVSHLEKSMQSKTLEKNTNEVKADADQRKKIAELTKQLQEARTKLHDTKTEFAETESRLSKVTVPTNITDLSDRNRPTRLAEKYAELYDHQWTDAFEVLEKSYHKEEFVIETLLNIFQDVFTFCLKMADVQMKNLGQELKFADREDKGDVTVGVGNLLKRCRKAVGFTENLPKMYQSYVEQSTNDRTKAALKVRAFTAECLEMCWFMVIQDPPVAFAPLPGKGSSFDTDFYKPYTISGAKVDFVVWPPLLLHEGGPILAKGVAQCCGKKTSA